MNKHSDLLIRHTSSRGCGEGPKSLQAAFPSLRIAYLKEDRPQIFKEPCLFLYPMLEGTNRDNPSVMYSIIPLYIQNPPHVHTQIPAVVQTRHSVSTFCSGQLVPPSLCV